MKVELSGSVTDKVPVAELSSLMVRLSGSTTGASFTGLTVMTKVWAAEVSTPPLSVPPSSERVTEIFATPKASGAGV